MIRKSTVKLEFANTGKKASLIAVLHDYNRAVNAFVDYLWEKEQFAGSFVKDTAWLNSPISARLKQCAAKQALAVVKSQRKKKNKTKPVVNSLSMELDSRFVNLEFDSNSFDIWINLTSLGNKLKLAIPACTHYHFNKFADWTIKKSIRIRFANNQLLADLYFEKVVEPSDKTKAKSFDIGYKKLLVDSDGVHYGKGFEALCHKISQKQQGSKAFKKALVERDCYINLTIKEAGIADCGTIAIELLKDVKKDSRKKRTMRKSFMNKLQRWTYSKIISRIKLTSEELGVQVIEINPRNTSRTCPSCRHIDKASRHGELFKCTACSYSNDADFVGAFNILDRAQQNMVAVAPRS